jgi:hypothetical protein
MPGNQDNPQADIPLKNASAPSAADDTLNGSSEVADIRNAGGAWADEKATARAKHDRAASPTNGPSLGDALAVGGGQQSTPFQLETQADAIARQTRRGDV